MKNDTTNPFGYKLGESTENNKALLFFSGKEIIQTFSGSDLSLYPVVCEVINLWTAMFENSAEIIIIIIIIIIKKSNQIFYW